MKVLKFFFLMIAALNLVSCSNDEPEIVTDEKPFHNTTDISYSKPIIFETENLDWLTEYDLSKNIYTTTIMSGKIIYKIKDDFDVPERFVIDKIVQEEDGVFENLDISDFSASVDSTTNFFKYSKSLLSISYNQKGSLEINLDTDRSNQPYNLRYFHIYLSDPKKNMGTEITLKDISDDYTWGTIPLNFDLSAIQYPCKRMYDNDLGFKDGFEYEIYLPSDECNFKLTTDVWFALQSVQLDDNSGKSQILYDYYKINGDKQFEFLPKNNPTYMIETDCGIFKFNGTKTSIFDPLSETSETFYSGTIDCRIPVNRSGGERSISLSLGFAMYRAGVTIIQAAE